MGNLENRRSKVPSLKKQGGIRIRGDIPGKQERDLTIGNFKNQGAEIGIRPLGTRHRGNHSRGGQKGLNKNPGVEYKRIPGIKQITRNPARPDRLMQQSPG